MDEQIKTNEDAVRRIEEIEKMLSAEREALETSRKRWIMVGALLAAVVFSYLTWAYVKITKFTAPEFLADSLGDIVAGELPNVLKDVEQKITDDAPAIVTSAGENLAEMVPSLRLQIENMIKKNLIVLIEEVADNADKSLLEVMKQDPEAVAEVIDAIESPAKGKKMFELIEGEMKESLNKIIIEHTNETLDKKLESSLKELDALKKKLRKLAPGAGLSREEQAERRLIQTLLKYIKMPEKE